MPKDSRLRKQQSAMEYLMTYGWAILIIAVVLIGLNYLGIFNSEAFAPKASPGACYVLRTAAEVSLAGECNGYIPRTVGQFSNAACPTGALVNVSVGTWVPTTQVTIEFWAYSTDDWNTYGGPDPEIIGQGTATNYMLMEARSNYENIGITGPPAGGCTASTAPLANDEWYQFVGTYNGTAYTLYQNGAVIKSCSSSGALSVASNSLYIGAGGYGGDCRLEYPFTGYMSNVQLYNTSLSGSTVQSLYAEGIGGSPIQLQNLVGWWPLNGDTNDYSGNGHNGFNNNVIFNGGWYTSYTPT